MKATSFALVGLLAMTSVAKASIITVQVNEIVPPGSSYGLTAVPGPNLDFSTPLIGTMASGTVYGVPGNTYFAATCCASVPLDSHPGDTIGPSTDLGTLPGTLVSCEAFVGCSGAFPADGSTQYLGFAFVASTMPTVYDYGYVTLSITGSAVNPVAIDIESYTYDDSGNPITIVGVPEPSSLALLAVAAGVIALLRKKSRFPSTPLQHPRCHQSRKR